MMPNSRWITLLLLAVGILQPTSAWADPSQALRPRSARELPAAAGLEDALDQSAAVPPRQNAASLEEKERLIALLNQVPLGSSKRQEAIRLACELCGFSTLEEFRPIRSTRGVVVAGGRGRRLREGGYTTPKALLPIAGRPLLFWVLDAFSFLKEPPLVIVNSEIKESVEEALREAGYQADLVVDDIGFGSYYSFLAPGVRQTLETFDGDLLVSWADLPLIRPETVKATLAIHHALGSAGYTFPTVVESDAPAWIVRDSRGRVTKHADSHEGSPPKQAWGEQGFGVWAMSAASLYRALETVGGEGVTPSATDKLRAPHLFNSFLHLRLPIIAANIAQPDEVMDVDVPEDVLRVDASVRQRLGLGPSSAGLEEVFRTELVNKMMSHDEFSLQGLIQWAGSFGKSPDELFAEMRQVGLTLLEDGEEWRSFYEVVTERGEPTGKAKVFSAIHRDGDWHRLVEVVLIAPDGRLILQRRPEGRLDISVGGHVPLGLTLQEAALASASRELNFVLDSARLYEIRNPLQGSQGLFRKAGRRDFLTVPHYDSQGIYHYRSNWASNREVHTAYLYLLTESELKDLQRRYQSNETRGLNYLTLEELQGDYQAHPKVFASGVAHYFSEKSVLSHIRHLIELARLEKERWVFIWHATFQRFAEEAQRQPGLFDTVGILLDQSLEGLGQKRIDVVVPKKDLLSPEFQRIILRHLAVTVNNAAWFFLGQPEDRDESRTLIQLASPWAEDLTAWIERETQLIPALSQKMLFGQVSPKAIKELSPQTAVSSSTIRFMSADRLNPTVESLIMGVDLGGTNLKFVTLRKGKVVHSELVSHWYREESKLAVLGIAGFFADQIWQHIQSIGLGGEIPTAIGISWPGPVRDSRILGSSTMEGLLKRLIEKMQQGVLRGDLALLQHELNELREGRFLDLLHREVVGRFKREVLIKPYRDAFAEAVGVAVATHHPAFYDKSGSPSKKGRILTLTLGTGVGSYPVEPDGKISVPGRPYLYEFGRVVVDMDPTKTRPNLSTQMTGTIAQLFGKEALGFENEDLEPEIGEALAAMALLMRNVLGIERMTLSGGNAHRGIVSIARAALRGFTPNGEPSVEIVMSPVLRVTGASHPIYTPAVGAAWAAFDVGLEEPAQKQLDSDLMQGLLGTRAVLIGREAFTRVSDLEEFLMQVPAELARHLVVVADINTVERLRAHESKVPVFSEPVEAVVHLAGMGGLEEITYLGPGEERPEVMASAQAINLPIHAVIPVIDMTFREWMWVLGRSLGVPDQLLRQLDLSGLEESVRQAA